MRRLFFVPCLAVLASAVFVLAPSREASAQEVVYVRSAFELGLDLNLHADVGDNNIDTISAGGDVRLGWRIPLGRDVWLVPELQGGWTDFGQTGGDLSAGRLMGGGRFTFGHNIQGSGFAHAGVAFVGLSGAPNIEADLTFDVGGAIDFRVARQVFIGGQVAYNRIELGGSGDIEALNYVSFGPHLQFSFH